jgi:hypothetical protein
VPLCGAVVAQLRQPINSVRGPLLAQDAAPFFTFFAFFCLPLRCALRTRESVPRVSATASFQPTEACLTETLFCVAVTQRGCLHYRRWTLLAVVLTWTSGTNQVV